VFLAGTGGYPHVVTGKHTTEKGVETTMTGMVSPALGAAAAGGVLGAQAGGELPFTGAPLLLYLVVAVGLVLAGLTVRAVGAKRR
jgi:hypothetical protein